MKKNGAYFVNDREAITKEYMPPNRTKLPFIFRRALQGGNSFTRREFESGNGNHIAQRLLMLFKGSCFILISFIFIILLYPFRGRRTLWIIQLASNIGRFLAVFNWHYKAYH
jgi:hypothetical protein